MDTVTCPYCKHEQEVSPDWSDGLPASGIFFQRCDECGRDFEVQADWMPLFHVIKPETEEVAPHAD